MRLRIIPALFILFIPLTSTAQSTFIKVLGRSNQDIFNDVDETIDGGILFGGNFAGNSSLTRCNSFADTVWNNTGPQVIGVSLFGMCTLNDGRIAFAGSSDDGTYHDGSIVITDSMCGLSSTAYFREDDSWGVYGNSVYAMPDSGVMFAAYEDGYTCSNVVHFYILDKNLNSVWNKGIGVCDAEFIYPHTFNPVTNCMSVLKLRYYDTDSLGNVFEDVPEVITFDKNGTTLLDKVIYIDKRFSGVSGVSDSGAVIYGYEDTLGSRQIHMTRIDKFGSILWQRSFGTIYDDYPVDIIETNDHGFAILASQFIPGTQTGVDLVFYKTDSSGQVTFSNTYGSTGNETAVAMKKKRDGSLLILGRTNGFGQKVNMVIQLDSTGQMNSEYTINSTSVHYCTGDTAILTVTPIASQYAWSTGETTSSISVTATGTYELTVTDSTGQEHLVPFHVIYFDSIPDATILNSSPVSFCEGHTAPLAVNSWTGTTYKWFYNGTLIDTAYHRIFFARDSGTYQAIVSNTCGTDTSDTVEVVKHLNPPMPHVTYYPSSRVCSNTPLKVFTNSTADTLHWKWNTNDVIGDTLVLTQPYNYYLSVQAIDSFGCISPVQYNVHATIDVQPNVNFANSTQNACTPGSTSLVYTSSSNYGNFTFLRNDTVVSTSGNPASFYVSTSAIYKIIMSNACGADTTSVIVTAYPKPVIHTYPSTPTPEICSGSPLVMTCTTPGTYRWYPGWNPTGIIVTTPSYEITTPGYHQLEVTDPATGCKSWRSINPVISSDPSPVLNLGSDTVLCPGNSITLTPGNFASYLWSSGTTDSTMLLSNTGTTDSLTIMLTVIDTSNCTATDTVNVVFDICAEVKENSKSVLSVYPNPSAAEMTFELQSSNLLNNAKLYLYSLDGKLVKEIEFEKSVLRINASDFSSDNYLYVLKAGNENYRGIVGFIK